MNSAPSHNSDGEYCSDPSKSSSSAGRSPLPDANDASPQPVTGKKSSNNSSNHNFQNYTDGLTFFKILVPSMAAGAIIGKGGETIAQLQQDTGTRIKMSKATDYFPGTNERLCIVYGQNAEGILQVHDFIAQKIRDKPDPGAKSAIDYDTKQPAEREKQVKILVPNSTAGMIIGKGGNYIKHVKEESAAYVQISQKAKDHTITERCITVIGEPAQNRRACQLILNKIFEDPQSNSCPNLSYADVMGPVPNYNPTGSPFANVLAGVGGTPGPGGANGTGGMDMNPYHSAANLNQIFGTLRNTLRMSGFAEEATNEIIAAMGTLASYGILGLGLGLGGLNVNMNMGYVSPVSGTTASVDSGYGNLHSTAPSSVNGGTSPGAGYGDGSSKSPLRFNGHHGQPQSDGVEMGGYGAAHSLYEQQQQQLSPGHLADGASAWSMGLHQQQRSVGGMPRWGTASGGRLPSNGNGYGHQDAALSMSGAGGERTQCSIEINENLVGALLGREGKNVSEIEQMCGTSIQVTKKKFSSGRRTVVITGQASQIQMTQMVIQQRLAQAEEKRALSHSLSVAVDGQLPTPGLNGNGQHHAPAMSPTSQFA